MFFHRLDVLSVCFRSPRGMLLLLVNPALWIRVSKKSRRASKKKHEEKDTPDDTGPAGSPALLVSGGTPKTRWRSDRFGALFLHRLRCSAAPNGEQPVCAYLFQAGDIRKTLLHGFT